MLPSGRLVPAFFVPLTRFQFRRICTIRTFLSSWSTQKLYLAILADADSDYGIGLSSSCAV